VAVLSLAKSPMSRKSATKPVEQRLIEALSTFTDPSSRSQHRPTISTLCRCAGVSRNTLYRYYPTMADKVRRLRRQLGRAPATRESVVKALRSEVASLRDQLAQLATLADHYFAAAEEQRALVARRDRELAALKVGSRSSRIPR
jgi:AcrR family transcriptional regulator